MHLPNHSSLPSLSWESSSSPSSSPKRELKRQWVIHGQPKASSGTFGTNLQILFPTSSSHPALDNHYHHYHKIMMVNLVLKYLANISSPKWQVFCTLLKAFDKDTFKKWRSSPKWFSVNRHHHHHHCAFNITAGEPNDVSTVGCSPEIQLSVFTWNPFSASVDLAPNQRDTE